LKKGGSEAGTVFKNLRGSTWRDVYVDFDPVRDLLRDLEVCLYGTSLMVGLLWGCHLVVL